MRTQVDAAPDVVTSPMTMMGCDDEDDDEEMPRTLLLNLSDDDGWVCRLDRDGVVPGELLRAIVMTRSADDGRS